MPVNRCAVRACSPPAISSWYLPHVPLGDVGEASDIAAVVQFLAGDEAAYITGQVLDVDGGWGAVKPPLMQPA